MNQEHSAEIIDLAQRHPDKLPRGFITWLSFNLPVWNEFVEHTKRAIEQGVKRYSSRTIICVMRHRHVLEGGEQFTKINNNYSPYLARLFDLAYPEYAGLWEYRQVSKMEEARMQLAVRDLFEEPGDGR